MKIRCMKCMKEYEEGESECPECGFVRGTPPREIYHLHPEVMLAGRYMVGAVVAYGGFGILYRAWDTKLEIMVAVKEYFPAVYVNRNPGEKEIFIYTSKKKGEFEQGLKGFLDEARNTSKFSSHPNIVNVYDYFQENGTAYMVMEFMEGMSLKEYTKEEGGRIPWEKAVEIGCCICDVLKEVHEAGILHRDISPDNIMLCRDGSVKLFDFGAARFSDVDNEATRTIILKIGFAPPEQYLQKSRQGPWTDIYALGATLYRSITGILPEESVNRQEAANRKEKDPLVRPKELQEEIPQYLDIAIMKAMAVQSELRFKNVMQFKNALLNKGRYIDIEEELKRKKKLRKIGIGAVVAALCVSGAACMGFYRSRQTQANLGETTVSVWMPLKEGDSEEEQKRVFGEMASEFLEDYPKVSLELRCIPAGEYKEALINAGAEEFPVLFESSGMEDELGDRMEELSGVYSLIDENEYYFLEYVAVRDSGRLQVPLGFYLPALYGNTSLIESQGKLPGENPREDFLKGKAPVMLSDSGDYAQVQQAVPGVYSIFGLPGSVKGVYEGLWSVDSRAPELQRLAAERLLYYLLGENAQDVLHIQNEGALPVNRSEFSVYMEVNQEFRFLEEQIRNPGKGEFVQDEKQEFYNRIYRDLYQEQEITMDLLQQWLRR